MQSSTMIKNYLCSSTVAAENGLQILQWTKSTNLDKWGLLGKGDFFSLAKGQTTQGMLGFMMQCTILLRNFVVETNKCPNL